MDRLPLIISSFSGAAGRYGGIAAQIIQDRLELLALELREAKIRLVQALLLACIGVVFSLLGLLLLVLAGLYVLPPEWRLYGIAGAAVVSMLVGITVFVVLCRHLGRKPLAFAQSLAELKKDTTCFSTKS
ncbi:MAG: phage holin family protein [Desulfocapsaceae bacterium]|nr:phage holin family protein [Desulfocapsaceae bacterium]